MAGNREALPTEDREAEAERQREHARAVLAHRKVVLESELGVHRNDLVAHADLARQAAEHARLVRVDLERVDYELEQVR